MKKGCDGMESILGDILEAAVEAAVEISAETILAPRKKTALITGAYGMLGSDVSEVFAKRYKVARLSSKKLDITDEHAVSLAIKITKPSVVVNCAAFTAVDLCETETLKANNVNGYGAGNVAKACAEVGATLIHISTDYVFDGEKGSPYYENDATNPLSVYGSSKLLGERLVREATDKHYIVRTQWLYGKNGANFAKKMIELGKSGKPLKVVNDQTGCPTYTPDLAEGLLNLLNGAPFGTYHITNSEPCTWYDFACETLKTAGISCEISPCETSEFPRPAKRPRFSVLLNESYEKAGNSPLRSYKEALKEYLR